MSTNVLGRAPPDRKAGNKPVSTPEGMGFQELILEDAENVDQEDGACCILIRDR